MVSILAYPSNYAMESVLSQVQNGEERAIAQASQTLSSQLARNVPVTFPEGYIQVIKKQVSE